MNKLKLTALSVSLALVLGSTGTAFAGAFQLFEQSAAGLGTGQATAGASANDASTEYTNPAGMVRFKSTEVTSGAEAIFLNIKFTGSTSTQENGIQNPTPTTGTGVANGGTLNLVPNFHYVIPLGSNLYYGGGLGVPFGLSTQYDKDSVAAQYATASDMQTLNFSQDLAYAVSSHFSVGAGVDFQQFEGEFDTMENILGTLLPDNNQASSNAVGWHTGVMYQLSPETRFGLSYHSQITQHATGTGQLASLPSSPVKTDFILPAWLTFGVHQDITSKWAVMATINYTYWDAIKQLSLNGVSFAGADINMDVPLNFKNTVEASLGTTYQLTNKWTAKFGAGFDQSPTNNANRELRLPDSDKINVSLGAHYQASEQVSLDFGYEHSFIKATQVNTSIALPDIPDLGLTNNAYVLNGSFNNSADIIGVQATYKF